ncbi:hypothetical protein C8T65DRAFT_641706 [Cerioporus squamosus]|nr:hypothetical protein C8T65DRAFT_641706 [Cerioporus squamosus]
MLKHAVMPGLVVPLSLPGLESCINMSGVIRSTLTRYQDVVLYATSSKGRHMTCNDGCDRRSQMCKQSCNWTRTSTSCTLSCSTDSRASAYSQSYWPPPNREAHQRH